MKSLRNEKRYVGTGRGRRGEVGTTGKSAISMRKMYERDFAHVVDAYKGPAEIRKSAI